MKKILIIGSGGREHALGWNLSHNNEISTIFYAPGNGGTEDDKGINISIDATKENFGKLYQFILKEKIDLVIVGPEKPLADGIVDYLNTRNYNKVFGPSQMASLLESDKFFSFDLMTKLNIPQAKSIKCYNLIQIIRAINILSTSEGIVLKARGLTGGKGVYVYSSKEDAFKDIDIAIRHGKDILVAERLFGQEFSVFGMSDGTKVLPFEIAFQDYKRLMENDKGPNTGGMGSYGPVPNISKDIIKNVCNRIMTPIILELKSMGIVYKGFLYVGMINTKNGPKVLEFNVRLGDPECQPAMMMLKNDLYYLITNALDGKNENINDIQFNNGAACCVVLASKGYPGEYKKGFPICGLEIIEKMENVKVFHAGTRKEDNRILTNGGRILGVTAFSNKNLEDARHKVYDAISKINSGFSYRKDIGLS